MHIVRVLFVNNQVHEYIYNTLEPARSAFDLVSSAQASDKTAVIWDDTARRSSMHGKSVACVQLVDMDGEVAGLVALSEEAGKLRQKYMPSAVAPPMDVARTESRRPRQADELHGNDIASAGLRFTE